MVAITIAGRANSTWIPCSESQPPNQPSSPYRRKSERPTTTGESASGRSMNAFSRPLPQNRFRTIASAQTIPKTVFTGTAIAVMINVSLNAWIVSGVARASHAADASWNVRQKTMTSGPTRTTAR